MTIKSERLSDSDRSNLDRAITLARDSKNFTHPNPRVGCVIADADDVVGVGVTAPGVGADHAEVVALQAAGSRARGATAFVTLEPCCHQGRTGPCTSALIEAGVARVVVAMLDPDSRVAGGGLKALRDAGVEVVVDDRESEVRSINRGFFSRVERGRPWVRLKMAASMDGRTAMASGESQWITSPQAREDVQRLRATCDAILTGIGTVLADDPRLTVRLEGSQSTPIRVVADSALRTPADAALFDQPGPVLVVGAAPSPNAIALEEAGAEVMIASGVDRVDLKAVMSELAAREINEVHTECGAELAGALLSADLVDEVVMYLAPKFLGGAARGVVDLPGLTALADADEFEISDIVRVGPDLRISLLPKR